MLGTEHSEKLYRKEMRESKAQSFRDKNRQESMKIGALTGIGKELEKQQRKIDRMKAELIAKLEALPENPRINVLSKKENGVTKAFTISNKDLGTKNWTPFYHSFKMQYEQIIKWLNSGSEPQTILERIGEIVRRGQVRVAGEVFYFHPDVVEQLKSLE